MTPRLSKAVVLPRVRPVIGPDQGSRKRLDWEILVPLFVHPVKVAIIEALEWIGEPLSATEMSTLFGSEYKLGVVAYHVETLAKAGVLEATDERQARGARETYYFFALTD